MNHIMKEKRIRLVILTNTENTSLKCTYYIIVNIMYIEICMCMCDIRVPLMMDYNFHHFSYKLYKKK